MDREFVEPSPPQWWEHSARTRAEVPVPLACDGDLNGDCQVNGIDLVTLLGTFGA